MEGLVTGETGASGASETTDQGRYKRKLSRKDERKKARASKKARNNKHHSKKLPQNGSTAPGTSKADRKGKARASQVGGSDNVVDAVLKVNEHQKKKGKAKKKKGKLATANKPEVSTEDANGPNAKFFQMLQADGLVDVEGGEGNAVVHEPVDEDEAEIKRMEKLLNMKGGKLSKEFVDDGLGGLLDFTNPDMDEEEGLQWTEGDRDSDAFTDEDGEVDRKTSQSAAAAAANAEEEEEEEEDSDIDEFAAIKIRAAAAAIAADYSDEDVVEYTDEELDSDDAFDATSEEEKADIDAGDEVELDAKSTPFQKAKSFEGSRPGYAFKMGPRGLGYYADTHQAISSSSSMRKANPAHKEATEGQGKKKKRKTRMDTEAEKNREVKTSSRDEGQNSGFFEMLRENGLVGENGEVPDGDDTVPDFEDDEDDAVIERMERLLKIKKGKIGKEFEEDGLDMLLGFEDEANEARKKWEAGGMKGFPGVDSSDEDEAPEEISARDERPDKSAITVGSAAADDDDGYEDDEDEDGTTGKRLIKGDGDSDDDDDDDDDDDSDGDDDDDDDENRSDADQNTENEDAEPLEPATYITRAEAFGNNLPGGGGAGVDAQPIRRWVPPSQRKPSDESVRVQRHVKGQLNRLNEANMVAIIKVIEGVFETRSRNEVSTVLTTFIMDACMNKSTTLQHLLTVYAAAVSAFHHVVGMEVSAHFLQELAERFQANYDRVAADMDKTGNEDTLDKQCTNLALMLCYLFNFRVVHSSVIIDFFDRLLDKFTPLDVEVLMSCLNTSASRLRGDDNPALNRILDVVKEKGASTEKQSTRMKWMLETIGETKGKGAVKYGNDAGETFVRLNKAVRSYVNHRKVGFKDPLRVPWADLLEAKSRGRWWLVGSAWAGRDGATGEPGVSQKTEGSSGDVNADAPVHAAENTELLGIAATQRMNTDIRRKIFVAMMGAEDYLDAFEKLLRLRLKDKQDREVVRILIDNCVQEKTYNPFYAHLGAKLCQHNHNHKFTFQYAYWDRFQLLEEMNVAQVSHLAKLLAHLIIQHALSMSVLKTVQFNLLGSKGVLTFQLFFVYLLTNYKESPTSKAFERLAMHEGQAALKDSFLVFMRHYVRKFTLGIGNGGDKRCVTPSQKHDLLYDRLKLAKRWLTRTSMTKRGTR